MTKKLLVSCTLGYQGTKIWPLLFNKISLQGNALSSSLFELSYPFKLEGIFMVPQVLVYCLYDVFIAFILCTTKMGFLILEQIEVRRSHIKRIWGWGRISNPHSVAAVMATCDEWAGAFLCKNRTTQVSFPRLFLAISWRNHLNCTVYHPLWSPLDYPKRLRSSPSMLNEPS